MALSRLNATLTAADLATAVGLPNIPEGCESALIQADTANVRYTADGTDPAADTGLRVINGNQPISIMGKLADFKFILESGSPNLNIQYQTEQ